MEEKESHALLGCDSSMRREERGLAALGAVVQIDYHSHEGSICCILGIITIIVPIEDLSFLICVPRNNKKCATVSREP